MLKIKDFARETGFSIRMLRYLEDMGLLAPQRNRSNYRAYTPEQVEIARQIKRLQGIGLQLREIPGVTGGTREVRLRILGQALQREQEIAEIKSDTIPELRALIEFVKSGHALEEYFKGAEAAPSLMRTLGANTKFHRIAHSIPVLRTIYEDHLVLETGIDLIATEFLKFKDWCQCIDG